MSLKIGIVGLPNVGKSTLFNALTKKSVPAENYPFCTIDPSVGIVPVPDERLDKLYDFSLPAASAKGSGAPRKIPAVVEFTDIAGLVAGASKGEGLGNQFLSHIRECDAIAEVVRIFEDKDILHVAGKVDPLSDIEVINLELILADLQTVTKRLGSLEKDVKSVASSAKASAGRGKEALIEKGALEKIQRVLEDGKLAAEALLQLDEKVASSATHRGGGSEFDYIKQLNLLTTKPILYVFNSSAASENLVIENLLKIENSKLKINSYVTIDPVFEKGLNDLIVKAYETLDLITFFTTGEDETRGWTTHRGATAPQAGRSIHGDFETKFIRAEVIEWDKLLEAGSYAAAREKALLRTEGKEYIVKDGDVIEFKI